MAKMQLMDGSGTVIDGIYFGEAERFSQYVSEKEVIMITYYPEVNRYQGRENLQVIIQEYR